MLSRIEVWKLIDPIQDLTDQLLQKDSGRDSHLPTQSTSYCTPQLLHIRIVRKDKNTFSVRRGLGINVADSFSHFEQPFRVETAEPDLHCSRVVKLCIRRKLNMKTLRKRRQTACALRPVEECAGPGD